jgi:protein O-mannosyl-transferase
LQNTPSSAFQKTALPMALLFLILLAAYSNTMNAAWHMDDKPNILDNARLHIDTFSPETVFQTFFASPGSEKKLYRPLPCFTFAVNWYLGKDDPAGYRAVNIFIHFIAAFVLFITVKEMFKTPALATRFSENDSYSIALLSATLWAVNPIHTQAVTYIVQRMTIMAGLFYLLGLFFYIRARLNTPSPKSLLLYFACFAGFIFALASKENAAIFPLAIVLVEIAFFQKKEGAASASFISSKVTLYIGLLVFIAAAFYFMKGNLFSFLDGYGVRSFSLSERFLTEFRVIVFYISQIFYPHPDRLSIDHDFPLSTSLMAPWTTLPAVMAVAALVLIGLSQIKKRPLLGFAILFFFLNHLIESTVIPLEIIFEHRNYLPSAFLFVPFAWGVITLLRGLRRKSHLAFSALVSCLVLLIISLGIGTYLRNMAWASQWTLWADAARKAPGNARPLNVLAIELGWNKAGTPENLDRALYLFHRSLGLYNPNKFQEAEILGNIAATHFKKAEYQKAVTYYEMTLQADPFFVKARYDLSETLAVLQEWEEASRQLDIVLKEGASRDSYYNLKGFVLLWQDRPAEALSYLRKALSIAPWKSSINLNIGVALSRMGASQNAEWFLNQARQLSTGDIVPLFFQVENSLRAKDTEKAKRYSRKILSLYSLKEVQKCLDAIPNRRDIAPLSYLMIAPAIRDAAIEGSNQLGQK